MSSNHTVIREVSQGVWTFSCPFARFGFLPVGGRSTAVKLSSGDVWVLASTPLDDATKNKLEEIGPVKYIIGADLKHHLYLGDFKKQYPEAVVIAPETVVNKKSKQGLVFGGAWGTNPTNAKYGFEGDIQHGSHRLCHNCPSIGVLFPYSHFSGHLNKDVAFFHGTSKTLIVADLLFNLPATEQYSQTNWSGRVPLIGNAFHPFGTLHKRFAWLMGVDKEAMKRDARTVNEWNFERIIPCHGDIVEKDAKAAWREAYKWYLE